MGWFSFTYCLYIAPAISALYFLAASWARHFEMVASRVRSFSHRRSLTVSPSMSPSMIWYLILFWVHASEQNLQVLASSLRLTKKSLNDSPCCWESSYDPQRFSTIVVIVSLEKQSVSARKTCLGWSSLSRPERLRYAGFSTLCPPEGQV